MWLPGGFQKFLAFMQSYLQHPAGIEHELVIVFKDCTYQNGELDQYHEFLHSNNIAYTELFFDGGFDIDVYFFVASKVDTEFAAFINNNSIILADNWLAKMYAGFQQENIGAVACSASYQSLYNTVYSENKWYWETTKSFNHNFRKYKMFLKAFFYWRFFVFRPFPNPHLRTNGFLIRRAVFLKINKPELTSKHKAYQFESGKQSFSNQLFKMGLQILVVDKNGKFYFPDEWKNSKTYMQEEQQNLMIADKQTIYYDNASDAEKKRLTHLSWGK